MNKAKAYRRLRKLQSINQETWNELALDSSQQEDNSMFGVRIPGFHRNSMDLSDRNRAEAELPSIRASTGLPRYRLRDMKQLTSECRPITAAVNTSVQTKLEYMHPPNPTKRKASTAISDSSSGFRGHRALLSKGQLKINGIIDKENESAVGDAEHKDKSVFPTASSMRKSLSTRRHNEQNGVYTPIKILTQSTDRPVSQQNESRIKRTSISLYFNATNHLPDDKKRQSLLSESNISMKYANPNNIQRQNAARIPSTVRRVQFDRKETPSTKTPVDSRPNTNQSARPVATSTVNLTDAIQTSKPLSLTTKNLDMFTTTLLKTDLAVPSNEHTDRTLAWILERQKESKEMLAKKFDEENRNQINLASRLETVVEDST